MKICGSLAVVSGSSSGIGEATARLLAEKGSHVVLLANDAGKLNDLAADIRREGRRAEAYAVDFGDAKTVAATVAHIVAVHGTPDLLVNNSSLGRRLPLLETSAEEAAAMLGLPYLAAFNLTREFLPGMLERGSGQIVNVASVACRLVWPGAVAYTAAHAAMAAFTNGLRADVQRSGVNVMLAMFGPVEANWTNGARKMVSPHQVAKAIIRGVARRRREIVEPRVFQLMFALNAFFPATVARCIAQ